MVCEHLHALTYLGQNFHAPPEVSDDDETTFLLSQDKLGQGLLGTRRVHVPFVFVILKFFIVILLQIILHDKLSLRVPSETLGRRMIHRHVMGHAGRLCRVGFY